MRTQFVFADDFQEHTHLGGTILQHYLEIQESLAALQVAVDR
jgi:hypothetical protein